MTNHVSSCNDVSTSTIYDVAVILPVHNGNPWLYDCLCSILNQNHRLNVQLSIFFDSCYDNCEENLESLRRKFLEKGFNVVISKEQRQIPRGVGYAKNQAVKQSSSKYLCFMDSDDTMHPDRIQKQFETAESNPNTLVGSKFQRSPEGSTERYTQWANSLDSYQLNHQIFTSHGPTVIMPTWFCSRDLFEKIGGFSEDGHGTPEDLIFFYQWRRNGLSVARCDESLLTYRYHPSATTFSIKEETIWSLRLKELTEAVLSKWKQFTIWNGGKQGRRLYRCLSEAMRSRVRCFCDVDRKKIGTNYTYEESSELPKPKVPIVHFRDAQKPFVICVKLGLTDGIFENNLKSLNLEEGIDFVYFS